MPQVQDPSKVDADWQEVLAQAQPAADAAAQTRSAQLNSDWQEVLAAAGQAHGPTTALERNVEGLKAIGRGGIQSLESLGAAVVRPFSSETADAMKNRTPGFLDVNPVTEAAMTPGERQTTIGLGETLGGFAPALIPGVGQSKLALAVAFALQGGEHAREINAQHPEATAGQRLANIAGQSLVGGLAGLGPAGALTRGGKGLASSVAREVLGGAAVGGAQDIGGQLVEKATVAPEKRIDLQQTLQSAATLALAGGLVGTARHLGELAAQQPAPTLPKPGTGTVGRPKSEPVPKAVTLDEAAQAAFQHARESSNAPNAEPVEPRPGAQEALDKLLRKAGVTPIWARHPEGEPLSFQGETAKDAKHVVLDSSLPDQDAIAVAFGHELGQHVVETRNPEDAKAWTELAAKYAPEALKAAHADFLGRVEQAMAPWKAATEQVKVANAALREARLGSDPAAIEQARARAAAATEMAKSAWDRSPKIRDPAKLAASEVPAYLKEDLGTLAYIGREHPDVLARIRLNNYGLWTRIVDALKKTLRAFKLTKALTSLEKDLKTLEDLGAKQPKGMSIETAIDLANKLNEHIEKLTVPEAMRAQPFQTRERVDFAKQWEAHQAENDQRLAAMREGGATEAEIRAEQKQFEQDREAARTAKKEMLGQAAQAQYEGTSMFRYHEQQALEKARAADEERAHPEMPVPEKKGAVDEGRQAIRAAAATEKKVRAKQSADKLAVLKERASESEKRIDETGQFSLPRTDTPEFHRWFGDSKVVDEKGEPLVVYHGVTRGGGDFNTFDTPSWFTSDEQTARNWAGAHHRKEWRVISAFLRIEKMYDFDADPLRLYRQYGIEMTPGEVGWGNAEALADMKRRGFDGYTWTEGDGDNLEHQYAVFSPEQIKSATGNRGTFDPNSQDIRASLPRMTPDRVERIAEGAQEALDNPAAREAFPVRTPSTGEKSSAFQIGVGQEQRRTLETVPLEHMAAQAQAELEADRVGTEKKLRAKIESGKPLEDWEHIATAQIAEDKTAAMLRSPSPESFREATRWTWMDREAGTKAGRALASRRRRGERYGLDAITAAIAEPSRYLKQKMRAMQDRIDRELNPEVRFSLLKQMDGLMEQAAKQNAAAVSAMARRGLDPALVSADYFKDPYTFHLSARTIAEAKSFGAEKAWNWLMQYRLAAMLSAPTTHLANILGNTAHLIYEGPTKKIAEAMVNAATLNNLSNTATLGEVATYMRAYLPGLAHAARNFIQAMRTDRPSFEKELEARGVLKPGDATSRLDVEGHAQGIGGKIGRVLRFPSLTLLTAEDEFFKTLSAHAEAVAQAYRMTGGDQVRMQALLDAPESAAWQAGLEHARKVTFQDKPNAEAEPFANWALTSINRGREALAFGPVKPLYFILPFTSTPFRILQRGLAVPFHPLVMLAKGVRTMMGAAGGYQDKPGAFARDAGTLGLSAGIAFAISELVHKRDEEGQDGLPAITGSRPWNPAEKAFQARTAPAYSVRIGDEYYSYGRLDPAATAIGALVDAAEAYRTASHSKDENAASAAFLRLVSSGFDMTKDKTFLRTLGDVFEALRAPEGAKAARLTRDTLVTPMVPNILRRGLSAGEEAQTTDAVRPHEGESAWPSMVRSIPGQLAPGVGAEPQLRYDVWGREVKANGRSGLARFLSPTPVTGTVQDVADLDMVLQRYNDRVDRGEMPPDAKKWYPDAPDPTYLDREGKKHYFSDEQYARLQRDGGQKAFEMASHVEMHNPPTEQDVDNIKRMVTAARRLTRISLAKEAQ